MVLYLLSCWCLWFLCLRQAKSEMQVEFYVSDIQEVGDGFAVATLAGVRRRHLRAAWPRVAEAAPPSPSVSRSVSCLHSSPLFLPFTQIIILTPVSVGAVSAAETYWRSTYSAPRVIFRRLVLISFIPSLSLMRLMHIFGDSVFFVFFPRDDRKHVGEALEWFLTKVFPPFRWSKTQSTSRLETWTITHPPSTGNRTPFISQR